MAIDPETLKLRYPAFAAVSVDTITYWLTDAAREVDASWGDDQEPATLALAAHNMTVTPGVLPSAAGVELPAGLTSFKSAAVSLNFSAAAVAQAVTGGFRATLYGREFLRYLRRHVGGPRLVGFVAPFPC